MFPTVAVEAGRVRLPLSATVPAAKPPDPSRWTMVDAVFEVSTPTHPSAVPFALTPAATPAAQLTGFAAKAVAVPAFPLRFAVIVPAEKLPEASRRTTALA